MAKKLTAKEFDARFEAGESILPHLDLEAAERPGTVPQRVNVDFPAWEVTALDQEAARLGITRQSLIKVWIAERIDALHSRNYGVAEKSPRWRP
jgi:hypothetical protein